MSVTEVVGRRLRMYREARGWTRAELAQRAGISPSIVSRVESAHQRGLDTAVLVKLVTALGVAADALLGLTPPAASDESEDSSDDEDDQGKPPTLVSQLSRLLRGLTLEDQVSVALLVQRWRKSRGPDQEHTGLSCSVAPLDDYLKVDRGPAVPSSWVVDEYPDDEPEDVRLTRAFVTAQLRASRFRTDRWGRTVKRHPSGALHRCFTPHHVHPFLARSDSGGVIYPDGADRVMRRIPIFGLGPRLVVEPHTLIAMLVPKPLWGIGVTQALYCLTPQPGAKATFASLALRLPALFLAVDPHRLAPDVRWSERGYRPRVIELSKIKIPTSMMTDALSWQKVDGVAGDIVRESADLRPPVELKPFERCLWWREHCPFLQELRVAVEAAINAGGDQ